MDTLILSSLSMNNYVSQYIRERCRDQADLYHVFQLDDNHIRPCLDCNSCSEKTPGLCVIRDQMDKILPVWVKADRIVFVSSLIYGTYDPLMKKALERIIVLKLSLYGIYRGEIHHRNRYPGIKTYFGLGMISSETELYKEEAAVFNSLVRRNAANFYSNQFGSAVFSQGEDNEIVRNRIDQLIFTGEI